MIEIAGNRKGFAPFFEGYRWNYLVDAILEDSVVSRVLADHESNPSVSVLELSNIKLYITGGDAGHPAAQGFLMGLKGFSALIPASEPWDAIIQKAFSGRCVALPRYAFTSTELDTARLKALCSKLPEDFQMAPMDIHLARRLVGEKSEFSSDHLLNYESPEDFKKRGFGFCILDQDEIVSVATTFATCAKGIEIQISTRDTHQRRGLATVVAARLILHSLEAGLDPNWDAANENSVGLAKKLGYTPQGTYNMYLITSSRMMMAITRFGLKIKKMLNK
jgi:RimJ/RimL family protein N-acetyltransferase